MKKFQTILLFIFIMFLLTFGLYFLGRLMLVSNPEVFRDLEEETFIGSIFLCWASGFLGGIVLGIIIGTLVAVIKEIWSFSWGIVGSSQEEENTEETIENIEEDKREEIITQEIQEIPIKVNRNELLDLEGN